jgi:hypothetical protein
MKQTKKRQVNNNNNNNNNKRKSKGTTTSQQQYIYKKTISPTVTPELARLFTSTTSTFRIKSRASIDMCRQKCVGNEKSPEVTARTYSSVFSLIKYLSQLAWPSLKQNQKIIMAHTRMACSIMY